MLNYTIPFWKKTPFLRLLIPLMIGIDLQWYHQLPALLWWYVLAISSTLFILFLFFPVFKKYRYGLLSGVSTGCIFLALGALITWSRDIRHHGDWLGNSYQSTDKLLVTLEEPPVEKNKSYKVNAKVNFLVRDGKRISVSGELILYFKKEQGDQNGNSLIKNLGYGSQIVFEKPLQEIKNSGNPGGFDYKRYSLFHGITHQVFLKPNEFKILESKNENKFIKFLFVARKKIINVIQTFIPGNKEQGLAEALLIGYKSDLDQDLVQSYTNTGVVHIIAISGMHLALIYWLLARLFRPLLKRKRIRWLHPILVIAGLWLFSLLAGGQASVIRSALMFSCIVIGESLARKTSIYNTLAVSAFILLCYNPFWLWDVGFQLSYAAVLSIVIFMRPIYNWFYIQNKILDFAWKLNAVSIAAQLLTVPISIFHFHQFPNYFLLTNFIAVPLSSIILLGEIALCIFSLIPFIAGLIGKILSWLIWIMNTYIGKVESLPYSLWDGLQINIVQTIVLFIIVAGAGYWLLEKNKTGLKIALAGLAGFFFLRSYSFIEMNRQHKIIIYNVPQRQAIDIIHGRNYTFLGDKDLLQDDFLRNFHLKPSRISSRIPVTSEATYLDKKNKYFIYGTERIMFINQPVSFPKSENKHPVDLLVISKNPKITIAALANSFDIKRMVLDGSVPAWKVKAWKKDCDSLHIPVYDVNEKGAFVMNIR